MPKEPHYLIVGAGIGGLAVALGLLRSGHRVTVLEAAPQLGEVGAGLSISPNAALALQYLGLGEALETLADCPDRTAVFHYRTGERLNGVSFGVDFLERFGAKYYQIHRADLHSSMAEAVTALDGECIQVGCEVTALDTGASGVTAVCRDGRRFSADVLLGCDGLRSVVRDALFETAAPTWTGQVAYRATLPVAGIEQFLSDVPTAVTVGPGHSVTRYRIRHGAMLNLVAIAQTDAWKEEGWSHPATVDELLAEHKGWNADLLAIMQAIPPRNLFKWALYVREPLTTWIKNRVALLGDAAHAMLPFLGMGAAMALEDAVVLARCVDTYADIDEALARYEAARIERVTKTMRDSEAQGRVLQASNPDEQTWADNEGAGDPAWTRFGYNPATVAI